MCREHHRRSSAIGPLLVAICVCGSIFFATALSGAQDPVVVPPVPERVPKYEEWLEANWPLTARDFRDLRMAKRSWIKQGQAADVDYVLSFFTYRVAQLTWASESTSLYSIRRELAEDLEAAASSPLRDAHRQIQDAVLPALRKIADGNYSPFARYNALLIIGSLNSQERFRQGGQPAVPRPDTLPFLLRFVTDRQQPTGIRLAAVVGVMRHAERGIGAAAERSNVMQAMLGVVTDENPPSAGESDGHAWLRGRAADIIGALRPSTGDATRGPILDAFGDILADRSNPLFLRSRVVAAIGETDFNGLTNRNYSVMIGQIALYLVDATKQPDPTVDQIRQALYYYEAGLNGDPNRQGGRSLVESAAAEPQHAQFVSELQAEMRKVDVADICNRASRLDPHEFTQEVRAAGKQIEDWLAPKLADNAPAIKRSSRTPEPGRQG